MPFTPTPRLTPRTATRRRLTGLQRPLPSAALVGALLVTAGWLPPPAARAANPTTATTPGKAAAPAAARKPAAPAPKRPLANQARGLALAQQTIEQVTAAQLEVAGRVLTGTADCEFKQQVHVQAVQGVPGHFQVAYLSRRFTMTPQETQTGAVRLEDRRAGVVWLQIPAKSMLMDARRGQRLVDSCQHTEQRVAVQAAAEAGQAAAGTGLGITAPVAAAATQPAAAAAPAATAASQPAPTAVAAPLAPASAPRPAGAADTPAAPSAGSAAAASASASASAATPPAPAASR